jgi:hypothetical protein
MTYIKKKDKYVFYDDNDRIIIITTNRTIGEKLCHKEKEPTEQK